ncbi:hypothetical protein ABDK00_013275 [Niabella insulamsoli]|uniref:hypothetical protein n=1 Tax=Niabella insulamsoli TaxID=3144874 RepID=UPI0031FBF74E
MKKGYSSEPVITNFTWQYKTYRAELYTIGGMTRPYYHVFINGTNRACLYFENGNWIVSSGKGFSLDIGQQLGEAIEKHYKIDGTKLR